MMMIVKYLLTKGKNGVITSLIFGIIFKKANEFEATVLLNVTFAAGSRL